ncbi:PREDICTED: probable protein phosphatase 2C 55 [Lupinus angustifolius]|nr:PREDICTED: probable protein phosphatase 2C 55 [Lupinus angustifolius]
MQFDHFSRLRTLIQRSIAGKEDFAAEFFIGKGKFLFGTSKFYHSANYWSCDRFMRPGCIALASSLDLVGKGRNLTVVNDLSCVFSSIRVCGYRIDSAGREFQSKTMAAPLSRAVVGVCCLDKLGLKRSHHSGNIHLSASLGNGGKVSMSLKNHQQPNRLEVYGYFIYSAAKTWRNSNPYSESGSRDFNSSSSTCFSVGPAQDVPFDTPACEEQLANSADSSAQKSPSGKSLKLISGSCYLPHPDKEETGGEDAHFICSEEQVLGVADGVGGWADLGVNSGFYSRELMSKSVDAIQEEPKGSIDPARVLEKAHSSTKARGSSTACIIALTDQGLNAINLGDSGFMVVRGGQTVFRSPVQQHDFNFTYQLECGSNGDLPSSGQVFTIPVAPGDVIIAGTDGLFDNLYNNEITAVVVQATRAGFSPQVTAQKIAALARLRALDKNRQTPFSTAAQDAGFRYYGGKLDDTTVVVSFITGSGDDA